MDTDNIGLVGDTDILAPDSAGHMCAVSIGVIGRIAPRRIKVGSSASESDMGRIDSGIDDVDIDSQSQIVARIEPVCIVEAVRIPIHGVKAGNALESPLKIEVRMLV